MIAEVIVDITHGNVDKIFDYKIEENTEISVGDRVLLPFGYQKIEGFVINIKDKTDVPPNRLKSVISVLDDMPPLTKETIDLANFVAKKYHALKSEVLRLMIPSEMRKGRVKEKKRTLVKLEMSDYASAVSLIRSNSKNQMGLIDAVFGGECNYTELASSFGYGALKALEEKGVISTYEEQFDRIPYEFMEVKKESLTLTSNQIRAVDTVSNTNKQVTLIKGVTGCGKTEIYLTLFENMLKQGKTAMMLVPEIALTPQMVGKLRGRFSGSVAIIHSGLSSGERFDEWWRIRKGDAKIVVGARSAVFAPLQNLGIIVIDEEHESSYSSENSPRYNTIDVARYRASANNCKVVLGSATPSIESYYKAQSGEYELCEINERVNEKVMPRFDIVDMKQEVKYGNKSVISNHLKDELKKCLDSGNQAILFLNRRGFASFYQCEECGYVCKCNDCDVSLTYHYEERALKCHYCGTKYVIPDVCPDCGGKHFKRGGIGTETVVKEIKTLFPTSKILRMDNDTTTTKESHNNILQAFRNREADILVGTQMVAKGHDFPSVTLVGIVNADMSLYFSDFRSGERTFQLITQVAGRAGRGKLQGKVVLQTYSPRHFILDFATKYNYDGFYEYEVNARQVTAFPPFADIIRVMMYGENEASVRKVARYLYNNITELKNQNEDCFSYFNGMKSPIKRIENKVRYQIIARLQGEKKDDVIEKIYEIVEQYKENGVVSFVEINPNSMF